MAGRSGCGHLGADDGREGIAAVAEAHRGEHRVGLVEAQVAVGDRADVADVGGDHGVLGHRLLQLAQHLARMHALRALGDLDATTRPSHGVHSSSSFSQTSFSALTVFRRSARSCGRPLAVGEPVVQRARRRLGVAADADRDLLDQAQHAVVAVDLDDLGVLRPVVEAVLRQRAEWSQPRAERQHNVGLGNHLHGGLRALIAQRPAPQRMIGRETVVVQIAVDDGRLQIFGKRFGLLAGHPT